MSFYWDDNDMVDKRKTFTPKCSEWIWKIERLWWFRKREFRRQLLPKYELKKKIKPLFYTSPWNFQFRHSFVLIEQEITNLWFLKISTIYSFLFITANLATFDDSFILHFVHFRSFCTPGCFSSLKPILIRYNNENFCTIDEVY